MQPIESKVISRIYGKGRGWAFFKNDFLDIGSAVAIDQVLSRLSKKKAIRRVMRGLYDYPAHSKLLGQDLGPNMDQVAQALARKFGWSIQVSGNTALNILNLSTQVPGRYVYLSDGKSNSYKIGAQELHFKKTTLKDSGLKHAESALLVQAIKALDKRTLTEDETRRLREYFGSKLGARILRDTRYTTSWVHEEIKKIFKDEGE